MTSKRLQKALDLLLNPWPTALAAIFLSLLLFDAFPADSIMYHLPFSARFLHLPGFPDFSNYMEGRFQGFPSLWRLLLGPGLIWNRPRLFIVPNLAALGLLAYCCRRILALPVALVICCCLSFPVSLFLFRSSLQDFFVNTMALSASICLFQPSASFDGKTRKPLWIGGWDLIGLLCLGLAANVKFQGFFLAILILLIAIFFRIRDTGFPSARGTLPSESGKLTLAVLLSLLIFLQPIINLSRFGNPFFPISLPGRPATEPRVETPIQYIPKIPLLTNPLSYIVSVTEIDPIIRSEAGFSFTRSWHNHNSPKPEFLPSPPDYKWIVTGGSNGLFFLTLFIAAFISVFPRHGKAVLEPTRLLILRKRLLLSSLFFMFLPQSMELRYYLISLFSPALVAISGEATPLRKLMRGLIVVGLWFALYSSFLMPIYFRMRTGEWTTSHGILSPDVYQKLPSAEKCKEIYRFQGVSATNPEPRRPEEFQAAMACHLRLTQRE